MNLFKSPLRERIDRMIDEITDKRADNAIKRNGITHRAEEYSKLLLEDSNMIIELKLLRKLIRK